MWRRKPPAIKSLPIISMFEIGMNSIKIKGDAYARCIYNNYVRCSSYNNNNSACFYFCVLASELQIDYKTRKKIDPSVKTIAEAQYVLQKNIMESVGQNKTTEQNEEDKDKNL